jgi:Icc-related predicted phosphoesterase
MIQKVWVYLIRYNSQAIMSMKILSVSDIIFQLLYSPQIKNRFSDVDCIISCGDLPYYYLEYIVSMLDTPLFYVRGNHDKVVEHESHGFKTAPAGGVNLNGKLVNYHDTLLAGVDGSIRYRAGPFMYSQSEMWLNIFSLVPGLFYNRIKYGRYLDIFVSHASPWGIHDKQDFAHQGVKSFLWLIHVFKPKYCLHGHIHVYHPDETIISYVGDTQVINTYGFREIVIE